MYERAISDTKGQVGACQTCLSPSVIYYWLFQGYGSDVVLCCLFFDIRVSVMFHLIMLVHCSFSLVWVAEWPPFGKKLPNLLAICPHCILSICDFGYFPFWFLRAGFAFWLYQFLFIAFILLFLTSFSVNDPLDLNFLTKCCMEDSGRHQEETKTIWQGNGCSPILQVR